MLPWKKHKFDLIEEEPQSKPKGYALSLHYSALTSLARSCPESALSRVGSMFKSKRRKLQITSEDPTYTVLYLGNATTIQSKGDGCTDAAVGKIWGKSEMGKNGTKMRLTVSSQGIRMVHLDDKARRPGHLYLLHRVTYCVADPRLPKIFAWIYRHEMKHKAVMLRCHAVLVSKPEKAKAMALLLYQTSATALAEFKRLKRRDDARHQQQQLVGGQSIPLVPLRKLLNGQCYYKPPVERSRSAPKLGSITEDALGEEEEEEEEEEEDREEVAVEEEEEEEKAMQFECEDILDTDPPQGKAEVCQMIAELVQMSLGNDLQSLKADLRVTRLLSGESTGSESSIDSSQESPLPTGPGRAPQESGTLRPPGGLQELKVQEVA